MNFGIVLDLMQQELQWFLTFGKAKFHFQVSFMALNEGLNYKMMYRRDGKGDKYLDITKVLDEILNRLDAIEDKLNKQETNES